MNPIAHVILKKGREIPLKAGHPWVFSNAIERTQGIINPGDLVYVKSFSEESLGIGTCNPKNSIQIRMLTHNAEETIDDVWMAEKLLKLEQDKKRFLPPQTNGYRITHADADFLPGLILDRYGDHFVFQIHTAGMDQLRDMIVSGIQKAFKPKTIIERSDIEIRTTEGLKRLPPTLHMGNLKGSVQFTENGISFWVNLMEGQKTGFFLDQRNARQKVRELAKGKTVLNLFCYTGAFSVYAALGEASSVTSIDISRQALEMAEKNFQLNNLDPEHERYQFIEADVMEFLEDGRQSYDLIICDPPAFGKSASQVEKALQAYGRLNEQCFRQLGANGILVSSSCSGRVSVEDFRHTLKISAGRANKDAKIIDFISQPYDHTQRLSFPEGAYLKTFILSL